MIRSISDLIIMLTNVAMASPESLGKVSNMGSKVDVNDMGRVSRVVNSSLFSTCEAVQETTIRDDDRSIQMQRTRQTANGVVQDYSDPESIACDAASCIARSASFLFHQSGHWACWPSGRSAPCSATPSLAGSRSPLATEGDEWTQPLDLLAEME